MAPEMPVDGGLIDDNWLRCVHRLSSAFGRRFSGWLGRSMVSFPVAQGHRPCTAGQPGNITVTVSPRLWPCA